MTWVGSGIATLGALLCLVAALGLMRLPDAPSRLHAVTKASTLGLALSLLGTVVIIPSIEAGVKAAIVVVFLWAVTPVSGHLIGRAAYRAGLIGRLGVNELHEIDDHRTDLHETGAPGRED